MFWTGYNIVQMGDSFTVKGEWEGEAWQNEDGTPKEEPLYKPGDKFIVNEKGWLVKTQCNCECSCVGC